MPSALYQALESAEAPYTDIALRLLFATTLVAGNCRYRIREVEFYAADDPYTHAGDEQISTCGGWYFHRTGPGKGWKGGTFMGVDLSFGPPGVAGGVLIRGLSRCDDDNSGPTYFDGSCNCCRELLRACDVSKIKDLVEMQNFSWNALAPNGILRLVSGPPTPISGSEQIGMEWKAASRVGLSAPDKKKDQLKERKKFHLQPFRFLSAPYETKKEKTKIKNSTVGGVFDGAEFSMAEESDDDDEEEDMELPQKKTKKSSKKAAAIIKAKDDPFAESDEDEEEDHDGKTSKQGGDSNEQEGTGDPFADSDDSSDSINAVWQYWLDSDVWDGKKRGWHQFGTGPCAKLESFVKKRREKKITETTFKLKSGHFSYEIDIKTMTQRNTKSDTVRAVRRVLKNEVYSMTEPPVYVPPERFSSKKKAEYSVAPKLTATTTASSKKHSTSEEPPAQPKKKKPKITSSSDDPGLKLEPLFVGQYGHAWEGVLTKALECQPDAARFIGPNRSNELHPVRELTFRSLMALPPEENTLIAFGEAPYPRVESASGIAMFDSMIKDWDSKQFGKTVSMRCIAKAAAIAKGIAAQDAKVGNLRYAFKQHNIVSPPEWFQAMLSQGVLLLNASLTSGGGPAFSKTQHTNFWKPIMRKIVEAILQAKINKFPEGTPKRRIAFLWWGGEALKTKKALQPVLQAYGDQLEITHIEHYNPAAQGDKFVQPPNHFVAVNKALTGAGLEAIDWLPNKQWLKDNHCDEHAHFITETQELHKLYLERLQAGLDLAELEPIVGIFASELCTLPDACEELGLRGAAESAVEKVSEFSAAGLSDDEKGAVYLYTTNCLYRRLNEALRHPNRNKVQVYFEYLRVFMEAYGKMKPKPISIYRGIGKVLASQYKVGSEVTWWNVSSCTPNISVAKNFGGGHPGGTLFHVKAKTAVPIMHLSAYQSEEEYVLAPGTVLKVNEVKKQAGNAVQIFLEEEEGKRLVS
mmetsp:Transcript_8775/g.18981  ORF Transcript_8775/g.18981 Transcript_8775/m.18981 type:complete len:975 (-) Transcript_8775:238-3162(-)